MYMLTSCKLFYGNFCARNQFLFRIKKVNKIYVQMLRDMSLSSQLKKAYAKTGALRRIRHFVPMDVMLALYKSFILPHLEYCSPLLIGVGKVQANKIEDANHYIFRDTHRAREIIVLPRTLKYM